MDFRSALGRRSVRRGVATIAALVLVAAVGVVVRFTLPGLFEDSPKPVAADTHTKSSPSPRAASPTAPVRRGQPDISKDVQARAKSLNQLARAAELANRRLARAGRVAGKGGGGVAEFTMASFNVLGDSHTRAGAESPGMASGATRMRSAIDLLRSRGVDVVSLQEFQRPQVQVFAANAGEFAMYPGVGARAIDAENSVAWRRDRFDLVDARSKAYPYFGFNPRNFPEVLLRDKASGVQFWVTSYHNPANTRAHGNNEAAKAKALSMQVANTRSVLATGTPMIIAGDMNDRQRYFCTMVGQTDMHAANGGSADGGGCAPPSPIWIDWILGSPAVTFSGYVKDQSPVGRISDHPLIYAQASVAG